MMTASGIEAALRLVFALEGWPAFTNIPEDKGGPTKGGITLEAWRAFYGADQTIEDLKAATDDQGRRLYREVYMRRPNFEAIDDLPLALHVVECGVVHGVFRAARWLQEAINNERARLVERGELFNPFAELRIDGAIGPRTVEALGRVSPTRIELWIEARRTDFFGDLIEQPGQVKFADGWLNRVSDAIKRIAKRERLN